MKVGILRVELFLEDCGSLKDKRMVLRSLKERIRNRFNVSIAEVDGMDKWQRAVVGVSAVSNETKHLYECLDGVVEFIRGELRVTIVDHETEIL
jgi:uncharacterized protein YlxP (DUF503 family)